MKLSLVPLVVACSFVSACDADDAPDTPRALLFDATFEDVDAVAARRGVSSEELAAQLAAPFSCERHGELCAAVGSDGAEQVVGQAWEMAVAGASDAEIEQATIELLGELPEPDEGFRSSKVPDGELSYVDAGQIFTIRVRASQYTILWTRYHKAQVWHFVETPAGNREPSSDDLFVELEGWRFMGGDTTMKTCDDAKFDDTTSCYRTFSTGGTQETFVSATVNMRTVTDDWV